MASLRHENHNGRKGWRLRFYVEGHRRSLWLGDVSKRIAGNIARHVEELARAKELNQSADTAAMRWAASIEGRIRETLVGWGLVEPANPRLTTDAGRLLGPFLDAYIATRTDCRSGTLTNFKQARRLLVEYFGETHPLRSITPADADRWRRWLLARIVTPASDGKPAKTMATATVSKHIKRTKTMFAEAVRDRLLLESPFADQKGASEANKERHYFVDRPTAAAVLDACPDDDWRLIFALTRFGGMRCPSEVTTLKWSDVLWDKNRLRIDSRKTGVRFCPIFPELRPILEAVANDRENDLVMNRRLVRGYPVDANLATQFHRILERAGIKPWPKTFINLRSTRRTELQEAFPSHVVDEWMGHSTKTAETHYLQVTEDHWSAGAVTHTGRQTDATTSDRLPVGGPTGGPIPAHQDASGAITDTKKAREMRALDALGCPVTDSPMTPTGLEPVSPP